VQTGAWHPRLGGGTDRPGPALRHADEGTPTRPVVLGQNVGSSIPHLVYQCEIGALVSRSVLYMSMSLDGCIAGPNDEPGNPGGDDFMRLHEWYGFASDAGPRAVTADEARIGGQVLDEIKETGAVLSGRNTVEQVDHWGGDHHDGVPIFVPSHRPPGPSVAKYPLVTYVTDGIASAMAQAKAAAGDRNVLVHGAYTAQAALAAGVLDELQIHQVPVLFGSGRRLFDVMSGRVELEIVRVIDTPEATHIRYRIVS
jgi:dihydrofolate reductase